MFGLALIGCPTEPGTEPGTPFTAVTGITGVKDTAVAGTPLTLTGTVEPADATNKAIVWMVT